MDAHQELRTAARRSFPASTVNIVDAVREGMNQQALNKVSERSMAKLYSMHRSKSRRIQGHADLDLAPLMAIIPNNLRDLLICDVVLHGQRILAFSSQFFLDFLMTTDTISIDGTFKVIKIFI